MSYLGTLLEFAEGSRLTGVALLPLAKEIRFLEGSVHLHVVMLPDGEDPAVVSAAVTTFMPATLATASGNDPDGATWFATFQLAMDDRDSVQVEQAADAALHRALDLTGFDDHDSWGQRLSGADLREAYGTLGDVTDWNLSDLLTGLLIELTNVDLAVVVAADGPDTALEKEHDERRRARMHDLLFVWAATYRGPDA